MFSGFVILLLMLFIVADVIMRNVFHNSIPGGFEIAQNYFLPLSVFLALPYVYGTGTLPKMDLLMHRFPVGVQSAVIYLLLGLEVLVFLALTFFSFGYAVDSLDRGRAFPAGGLLLPIWPVLFLVPVSFLMMFIEAVFTISKNVARGSVTYSLGTDAPEGI
ncbi:TRAP transporter small permease [Janibacter cremeus]|uniref:TRAP transporter small permease n=1 Tax=Janibacter cremeus TaxID=1285192 RepID=UPI0023F9EA73|nr:TRAP transporter small permease [Janibacter cremeus]WEV78736.1 TRAP transporter small permease [Janibacter cremeus]